MGYNIGPDSYVENGILVNQTIAAAGDVKSPNGGLFDAGAHQFVEFDVVITAETGTVTNVEVRATESDTDTAAGQSDVSGASLSFTPNAGELRSMSVRWYGRKRFCGVRVLVTGGTSVGVVVIAKGHGIRDSAEIQPLSTLVAASTLA